MAASNTSTASTAGIASVPQSDHVVDVSIINTLGLVGKIPVDGFTTGGPVGKHKYLTCPCYCFLVHHKPTDTRLLFDLGIRKDWETGFPPKLLERLKATNWEIVAPIDTADILTLHNVQLNLIQSIIWSHQHWDHTGDVSKFPTTTSVTVGPGFKAEYMPAYPEREDSVIDARHVAGREMVEVDFTQSSTPRIGAYDAIDYFGDGSFYLLSTPGHTIGHISALARTTGGKDSTFIFMGGDIAHHAGEFRPSPQLPLPENITPDPRQPPFLPSASGSFCPGSIFTDLRPASMKQTDADPRTTPFYGTAAAEDVKLAQETLDDLPRLDGSPDVLTVFAHDPSLRDVLGFFPEKANDWKQKGWRREGLWRFLAEFL